MEIYEKKHYFDAALDAMIYLCMIVFGLALLGSGHDAWWRFPDWVWVSFVVIGVVFVLLGLAMLCLMINRYIEVHLGGKPVAIISNDCLQIFSVLGKYETIYWDEVIDFKIQYSRRSSSCYPVFKDDSRNKTFYLLFHASLLSSHLTISEQELLDELKKHITKV